MWIQRRSVLTSSTGGGSILLNILKRTVISAGFRAPLDNMAPSAWQALGYAAAVPSARVI